MKQIIIAGNWKSNKTMQESSQWIDQFAAGSATMTIQSSVRSLICAPYTDLSVIHTAIKNHTLSLMLGAQNISSFKDGAYTGEVSGRMIKEVADWVIIGHSERRKYMKEDDQMLALKVTQAKEAGLSVIYCISDKSMSVPHGVDVVAYEPLWAIGTGKTDTPDNANETIGAIKASSGVAVALYGGSITAENVRLFVQEPAIDGVLIGGASLDPASFIRILTSVS